jgi:hypothetical protein
MDCGARDLEVTRPGWAQSLGDWLRFGGPWRLPRRVCRRCGNASDSRSYGTLRAARRGWWSVPIRLVQTLRHHRTMIPVPATYLAATVVGAVVTVSAQLLFDWPWWLLAAAVVAAVWLFFASTALWGAGGSSQPLATDLLRVVRPHKAIQRDHRQQVERFRAAPFPVYGLPPAWSGPRHLGGWEGSWTKGQQPVTTAISLGHGDPLTDQEPELRVEVRAEHVETEQVMTVWVQSRRDLAENLWLAAAPQAHDLAEHCEQLAAARRRPDPAWSQVTIPVDGRPVAFAWLAEGRHWVARAELDDRTLTLHGRDLPVESVELVRVTDPEPYIEGTRRLEQVWARYHDKDTIELNQLERSSNDATYARSWLGWRCRGSW